MLFRLILTFSLVSTVTGCMPIETENTNQEAPHSESTQNHRTNQDEKTNELYLPGQDE